MAENLYDCRAPNEEEMEQASSVSTDDELYILQRVGGNERIMFPPALTTDDSSELKFGKRYNVQQQQNGRYRVIVQQ